MASMKCVDGVMIAMTPAEEAEIAALQSAIADHVPAAVSRAQAKIALSRAGLLRAVESMVSGETAIWYADALTWRRDNPNVNALGAALGLTDAQIDDLFRQAAQIQE